MGEKNNGVKRPDCSILNLAHLHYNVLRVKRYVSDKSGSEFVRLKKIQSCTLVIFKTFIKVKIASQLIFYMFGNIIRCCMYYCTYFHTVQVLNV